MYGYGPPSMQRQEVHLFSEQGIQVTSARFVVFQQTYPIAGITSISPFTIPAQRAGLILGALFFGLCTLGGCGLMLGDDHNPVGVIVFGLFMGLCIWGAVSRKPMHGLMISTAGMNVRALTSQDFNQVQRVMAALNQAIAMR